MCPEKESNSKNRAPLVSVQRPSQENSDILVAVDYFTQWVEAFTISNQEAVTVARKLVDEMFCHFLLPEQLTRVASLSLNFWQKYADYWAYTKQEQQLTTHSWMGWWNTGKGCILLSNLSTCVEDHPESWEDFVIQICMAYNTSIHLSTGFTLFYLMFGRQARLSVKFMYSTPEPEKLPCTQYAAAWA